MLWQPYRLPSASSFSSSQSAGVPTRRWLNAYGCHNNRKARGITAIVARLPGNRSAQRKRCSRNSQRILTERPRQMLRSKAKSPSERKEPPTPKKPPIKEPKKVKKPIGDPPPKRAPKRVALYRDFQDSIWQS